MGGNASQNQPPGLAHSRSNPGCGPRHKQIPVLWPEPKGTARRIRVPSRAGVSIVATTPDHIVDEAVPRAHRSDPATFAVREFDRRPV